MRLQMDFYGQLPKSQIMTTLPRFWPQVLQQSHLVCSLLPKSSFILTMVGILQRRPIFRTMSLHKGSDFDIHGVFTIHSTRRMPLSQAFSHQWQARPRNMAKKNWWKRPISHIFARIPRNPFPSDTLSFRTRRLGKSNGCKPLARSWKVCQTTSEWVFSIGSRHELNLQRWVVNVRTSFSSTLHIPNVR